MASLERLRAITAECGFELAARLTVHPEYVRAALHGGSPWLDPRVQVHVAALATEDGLAKPGVRPTGLPWQEPDGGFASVGRTDLFAAVDTEGRTDDRRSDGVAGRTSPRNGHAAVTIDPLLTGEPVEG